MHHKQQLVRELEEQLKESELRFKQAEFLPTLPTGQLSTKSAQLSCARCLEYLQSIEQLHVEAAAKQEAMEVSEARLGAARVELGQSKEAHAEQCRKRDAEYALLKKEFLASQVSSTSPYFSLPSIFPSLIFTTF